MKKLLAILLFLAASKMAVAQQNQVLSAAAASCTTTNTSCLIVSVDQTQGGSTFTITNNASGNTISFIASGDGGKTFVALNVTPSNGTTAVTSSNSTGTWQANVAGYTQIGMRMSTLVGGTTTVSMIQSTASARAGGGGGGGGGGSVTACTTTGGVAFENGTNNTLTCDANLTWIEAAGPTGGFTALNAVTNTGTGPVLGLGAAIDWTVNSPNSTNSDMVATSGAATAHGSGHFVGMVQGVSGTANFDGSGTVDELAGNATEPNTNTGGGTVTLSVGYDCGDQHGVSGTLNACYYSPDQGSGANDYAAYFAGGKVHSVGQIDSNGGFLANADGTHPGNVSLVGNTTVVAPVVNTFNIMGPSVTTFTAYALQFPNAAPAAGTLLQLGAPSSAVSQATYTPTPTLGVDNSVAGTLTLASTAGSAHTILSSVATTTNTIAGFAVVPTTNTVVKCVSASTTCTLTPSAIVDNGTTVNTGSESIVTTGSVSTGTSPPTCTVGTGGALCGNEGTTSTGAASVDQLWADSTGHCWHANFNNTDDGCVATLTPAQTFASLITLTTGTAAPLYEAGASGTSNTFQGGVDAAASSTLGSTTLRGADNSQANASAVAGSTTVRGGDATGATTNTTAGSLTIRGGNVASTSTPVPGAVTITGGGVTGAATNVAGAEVSVASGLGTGNAAVSHVKIKSPALGLASGTSAEAQITRFVTHVKAGSTSSATPTTMFNIASATNTAWGVEILVHVDLISSTPNVCGTTERISLTGTNNNGAFGTVNVTPGTISTLCSAGTLTLAATATAANPSVVSITPTWGTITSITSATITIEIDNVSQQEIALL